ncbi:MAG: DEAD/DEAH box helicase, partial [bacterium]|nr:DEAD/DEAH box helicase [bacterium]
MSVFEVHAVRIGGEHAMEALSRLADSADAIDESPDESWIAGASFAFFGECARLVRHVMAQQRFVPMLVQTVGGDLHAAWYPWMSDEAMASRVAQFVEAMPSSARAVVDRTNHDAWAITEDFLGSMIDQTCRRVLVREDFATSIEGRDAATDPHVAWLSGLLGNGHTLPPSPGLRQELSKRVRTWVGVLEERGASSAWRLFLRLNEPAIVTLKPDESPDPAAPVWALSFHMQSVDKPDLIVDAEDLWLVTGDSITIQGRRLDRPQELLLGELGCAMRFFRRLESALEEREPTDVVLNTRQAYEFLREVRPILLEQGFGVQAPDWWDSPSARVGAKLKLESEGDNPLDLSSGGYGSATGSKLGVTALVNYTWEIAVGDATLSLVEFEQLASRKVPLVRVNGRWVEIRPEDVQAAIRFIRENPGGRIKIAEALRLAYGSDLRQTGIPVVGLEATGWMAAFLSSEASSQQITMIETPGSFKGTLRPYQVRGVSWLIFQERLGFGVCLADDMGLGKTVQLLALLAWEREHSNGNPVAPTLLVVPMSVVGNWIHETARFCPHLRVLVHHGPERLLGEKFAQATAASDLVITTYSLAHRDREMLGNVGWGRVVLDEAQYIK